MTTNTKAGRRLVGAVAGAGVATALLVSAAAAAPDHIYGEGDLRDLQLATSQPTDGAQARVRVMEGGNGTTVTLHVSGLDASLAGHRMGAHVHVGPCVAGNGTAAGPHYNAGGGISEDTEVWLDFEIGNNGKGVGTTHVPFTIAPGAAQSVVVHAVATDRLTGAAGARWACLPVEF